MTKLDMLTKDGAKEGSIDLPEAFKVTPKPALLHQAVVAYLANQRTNTAHTKTRGEVAGGGRKPWKQKGTGRARAGSSRSPIWVGGGITFGPRSTDNYSKRLPSHLKRLALSMALSAKTSDKKLFVITDFEIAEAKTKHVANLLAKVAPESSSVLLVTAEMDAKLVKASRNIPTVTVRPARELTTYEVLAFDTVILTQAAVDSLGKSLAGKDR